MVVLGIVLIIALFIYDPTREFIKITALIGMPALVIWAYQKRFERLSVPWILCALVLVGLAVGYGFMLQDLPDKVGWRGAQRQGDVYLSAGQYDRAISQYKEMAKYGKEAKAEGKIREALEQKKFDKRYREAKQLAAENKYAEARRLLEGIPGTAVVYPQAHKLMKEIEDRSF